MISQEILNGAAISFSFSGGLDTSFKIVLQRIVPMASRKKIKLTPFKSVLIKIPPEKTIWSFKPRKLNHCSMARWNSNIKTMYLKNETMSHVT